MTTLNEYINESLTRTQKWIVGSIVVDMLKGSKLTKEQINNMFNNLDLAIIADIEDYIYNTDKENFMAYSADKDEFLKNDNKPNIINKLSDYFGTFVVNS